MLCHRRPFLLRSPRGVCFRGPFWFKYIFYFSEWPFWAFPDVGNGLLRCHHCVWTTVWCTWEWCSWCGRGGQVGLFRCYHPSHSWPSGTGWQSTALSRVVRAPAKSLWPSLEDRLLLVWVWCGVWGKSDSTSALLLPSCSIGSAGHHWVFSLDFVFTFYFLRHTQLNPFKAAFMKSLNS